MRHSGFLNGIIAYGLSFTHSSVAGWRLMYIVEGLPSWPLAIWGLYALPGSLQSAKRLTTKEKELGQSFASTTRSF